MVLESISQDKPLKCIGYYLPEINFAKLLKEEKEGKIFAQSVYFIEAVFYKASDFSEVRFANEANFRLAKFSEVAVFYGVEFSKVPVFYGAIFAKAVFRYVLFRKGADFSITEFLGEAYFVDNRFMDKTLFKYAIFEQPNKVTFDDTNLGYVSFADSDITRIRFGDGITWGGMRWRGWRGAAEGYRIIDEILLINRAELNKKKRTEDKEKKQNYEDVSLELVLSVYRNLRENYEFRLRYDDAGQFFIREMELRRKYRHVRPSFVLMFRGEIRENCWFRRHFSLTGLYYHLSRYGESISRPTLIAVITVLLSTLFWLTQSNPNLEPHFPPALETNSTSTFVGFREIDNATQWVKGFERSLAGFLPFLSVGGETQVGIIDYIIKIFGGGLTFVLLAIALRRKFERKYTR